MTSRAQATGASASITFNGKTVLISPLNDQDYGEFEVWMQQRFFAIIKVGVKDLSSADRQAVLIDAAKEMPYLTINSPKAQETMTCIDGAGRMFWMALRHKQPEITLEEVLEWITNEDNLDIALASLEHINPADPTKRAAAKTARKKASRKKTATASRQRNR